MFVWNIVENRIFRPDPKPKPNQLFFPIKNYVNFSFNDTLIFDFIEKYAKKNYKQIFIKWPKRLTYTICVFVWRESIVELDSSSSLYEQLLQQSYNHTFGHITHMSDFLYDPTHRLKRGNSYFTDVDCRLHGYNFPKSPIIITERIVHHYLVLRRSTYCIFNDLFFTFYGLMFWKRNLYSIYFHLLHIYRHFRYF